MTLHSRSNRYLAGLVGRLRSLTSETEWVEFKVNNIKPEMIGRSVSALANGAALRGKAKAYMLWGIEDSSHDVVGTDFSVSAKKVGNEPLENWLDRLLSPSVGFQFQDVDIDGLRVVVLEIACASWRPVAFKGEEFIRVGSVTKKLKDIPEKERALWRVFDSERFESGIAAEWLNDDAVLAKLDYPAYFELLEMPIPSSHAAVLDALRSDDLIADCEAGGWNITNLGAALFARKLGDFPSIRRKAMRVVQYKGNSRFETVREQEGQKGYAVGFSGMITYIMALVPTSEVIEQSFRRAVPMFPALAVRELAANALIHQDFLVRGAGPMVELFDDRIEITSPGEPLINTDRFVDSPPRSRNEALAALMRRFRICEERGSGIDKVVEQAEMLQLPAPLIEAAEGFTRVTMFAPKPLSDMDKGERVHACYMHACLRFVTSQPMNNASVQERFGISSKSAAIAYELLAEALDAGQIIIRDPAAGARIRTYLPYWAGNRSQIV